jgi:phosphoribosylamine--glycine ligase
MLTPDGPRVIEFNVRFGDPEAQALMPILKGPLAEVLMASATNDLADGVLHMSDQRTVAIVLAARGYPGRVDAGQTIEGLERAAARTGVQVFHAGTREDRGRIVAAGGRVLTVVATGDDYASAMDRAYAAASDIHFDGMQYRRDIGRKAVQESYGA